MSFLSDRRFRALVIASLGLLWPAATMAATDPFHSRLLREGIQAYQTGDAGAAAKSLRLACFGLLDEPPVLARCLTYLAAAQGDLGDEDAFAATFDRILEVERRFEAFSQLDLDTALRGDLEAYLEQWIAPEALASAPSFLHVARRKLEARIAEGSPEERRRELERLVALEPEEARWHLLLAELELGDGDYPTALAAAEAALARDPQLERATCVRARAGAATGACAQALADLDACGEQVATPVLRETRLRCLIAVGNWQDAAAVLSELPTGDRSRAPFRQLAREVRRGEKAAARAARAAGPIPAEGTDPAPDGSTPDSVAGEGTVADEGEIATEEDKPEAAELGVAESAGEVSADTLADLEPPPATPATPQPALDAGPMQDGSRARDASSPGDPQAGPGELQTELEKARGLLRSGSYEELAEALTRMRQLAERHPLAAAETQYLAAELAYRLSRWPDVVALYQRAGAPAPSHPDHLFYYAVALYETGDRAAARYALERCLPFLEMTNFVRSYVDRILGAGG